MCSLVSARGLRTSDAIPEATRAEKFTLDSLSTTVSFKYAPTATQPSISYYNVKKIITVCGKKKILKNSGLHVDIRTHKVCSRVRTLALNFFFGFSFWNCVHFLIRNLSHADNSAISQTLQVSNFRYLPRSAEEIFRFNG